MQQILNDRYRLDQKIGEGGMATVYQGYDIRLNRRVAVKILHSHYINDADFLRRFDHEARAAANLNHANVVNVYDVGQDGDIHYIVMQYVDGINLKTLINREAPLLIAYAVSIAEAIALGLEAAHREGLIHRDIKPQNVIVGTDGHVRITDFGIAKSHLSTALTQTGITFGTADYISPEQAQGQTATPQSDIYSLGVTLYEMLTGRLPYTGDNAVSIAMQHVNTPPPAPRQLNPQIPDQLEHLVLQALAKNPSERPASAQAFAHMLRHYRSVAEQPTSANAAGISAPRPSAPATRPAAQRGGTHSSSGNTGGRSTIPASRPKLGRAPSQQGVGCGTFVVGLLVLSGVLGLLLLFISGSFDTLVAGINTPAPSSPVVSPTLAASTTPTPTPSSTPTVSPTPVSLIIVPSIVGLNESEARQVLQRAGLVAVAGESRHSDTIPQGSVIEQQVPAQIEVPEAHAVTYTLSLGREIRLVQIPSLVSRRLESARAEAESLGLQVQVDEQPSPTVSEGFIISQQPSPGMQVEEGDILLLTVSVGDKVWMPDVIGKSEAEARAILEATQGLSVSWSDYQGVDKLGDLYYQVAPGTVVSTAPDKEQWVPRGTQVTLGVRAPDTPQTSLPPLPENPQER
jgi:serine/threonine-protein kinase